jgi:hypothetical protein
VQFFHKIGPKPDRDYYTKEEIDTLLQASLENALANIDHWRDEVREWRKALLDLLGGGDTELKRGPAELSRRFLP